MEKNEMLQAEAGMLKSLFCVVEQLESSLEKQ